MAFGKPSYNKTEYKKILTVGENETLEFRVLPPMKSRIRKGEWMKYHRQHFGYSVPSKNDASKQVPMPFYCIEKMDFRTKTVTQNCPECDKIRTIKDRIEATTVKLKEQGKDEATIKKQLEPLNSWKQKHNIDNKAYLNVKLKDGRFATLKVAHTVMKAMKDEMDKLIARKPPLDPIDVDGGVWWRVTRTGVGIGTKYAVEVVRELVPREGEVFETIKKAPLTEKDAEDAEDAVFDLADVGIRLLDADKIEALVQSNGNPDVIEAVFAATEKAPSRQEESSEASPAPTVKPAAAVKEPAAKLAEASPAAEQKVTEPATETPYSAMGDPSDMDDETFAILYGPKK